MLRTCSRFAWRPNTVIYQVGNTRYKSANRAWLPVPFHCRPVVHNKFISSLIPSIRRKSLVVDKHRYLSSAADGSGDSKDETAKLSQRQKLKIAVRDYGAVVVVFHIGISLLSLGGFYLAVANGFDAVYFLQKIGFAEYATNKVLVEGSTFVIAYGIHKLFAPVRIAITLSSAPFIVRYLRKVQILKSPKVK